MSPLNTPGPVLPALEPKGAKVQVTDLADNSIEEVIIPPGDYLLICTTPCYESYVQAFSSGTHQITIKGRIQR